MQRNLRNKSWRRMLDIAFQGAKSDLLIVSDQLCLFCKILLLLNMVLNIWQLFESRLASHPWKFINWKRYVPALLPSSQIGYNHVFGILMLKYNLKFIYRHFWHFLWHWKFIKYLSIEILLFCYDDVYNFWIF